jgi:MarR family transcriptional regulator, transcriptional regulator for hemolysin
MILTREEICEDVQMAAKASDELAIAEFAGQLFFRLWRASHTRIAESLQSLGLTPALFGLLNVVGARKGANQQELGAAMGIDRSTMVLLVDELEAKGMAERRPHPSDRRAREVAITLAGSKALRSARQMATHVEDEVLRGLSDAERRELLRLLRHALSTAPPQSDWRAGEGD